MKTLVLRANPKKTRKRRVTHVKRNPPQILSGGYVIVGINKTKEGHVYRRLNKYQNYAKRRRYYDGARGFGPTLAWAATYAKQKTAYLIAKELLPRLPKGIDTLEIHRLRDERGRDSE